MPLDHYVSQVHLRNFYSPALGERLYATSKISGKRFTPRSEDICRVDDGSTNTYLQQPRIIEEFLKGIEPKYNRAVERIANGNLDLETIYVLAGFTAYVQTCSPTGARVHSGQLKYALEHTAMALDNRGHFPEPPDGLGGKTFSQLLRDGTVKLTVDEKYPQAIGIAGVLESTAMLGNFTWEILKNDYQDSPFFTSDYPIAWEATSDYRIINRIVPLSPTIAIRMIPNIELNRNNCDFSFRDFACRAKKASREMVRSVNQLIVRCAEDLVLYRDYHEWIDRFIESNRKYRLEIVGDTIPHEKGSLLMGRLKICQI